MQTIRKNKWNKLLKKAWKNLKNIEKLKVKKTILILEYWNSYDFVGAEK